jgi:DNA methylase/restriction endonuclease
VPRTPAVNTLFYGDNLHILREHIAASSNEGDLVLDPFCGCGTTVQAAQKLNRRWIGIDVTHLAIGLVRRRLIDAFPQAQFEVQGVPKDLGAAEELARADKHQFQLWALSMIEAQPYKGGRKGADGGVDGLLYFKPDGRTTEKAIVEVKGGENVSPQWVRALGIVVERERARMGVLAMLGDPTVTMRRPRRRGSTRPNTAASRKSRSSPSRTCSTARSRTCPGSTRACSRRRSGRIRRSRAGLSFEAQADRKSATPPPLPGGEVGASRQRRPGEGSGASDEGATAAPSPVKSLPSPGALPRTRPLPWER